MPHEHTKSPEAFASGRCELAIDIQLSEAAKHVGQYHHDHAAANIDDAGSAGLLYDFGLITKFFLGALLGNDGHRQSQGHHCQAEQI